MTMTQDLDTLRQLEIDARRLMASAWDCDAAGDVCERAEVLSDQLSDPQHASLAEACLGFAAYLSAFTGSRAGPVQQKRAQLIALLDAVTEQMHRLEDAGVDLDLPEDVPEHGPMLLDPPTPEAHGRVPAPIHDLPLPATKTPVNTIIFIDPSGRDAAALGIALEDCGYVVQPLLRLDRQTGQLLGQEEVKALILPAAALDIWSKLAQLDPALDQARRRIGLFVVSRSDDPRQRLAAAKVSADGYFVLPADVDQLAREIVATLADRLDPYRALFVDDDLSMTMVVESVLRRSGMATRVVHDPTRALEAIESFDPDVILLDLHMPNLNGLELLSLFRAHPKTAFTPVILISGDDDQERRFETLTAGGDDFLKKPLRPKHLVAAVVGRAQRARWLKRALSVSRR